MYKILISGYYGFNNIGDEAILKIVIDNILEKIPNADITVLSHDPESTTEKFGVKAVPRMSFSAILKSVAKCDILISGGGSLLQDSTSPRSILYYLAIIRLAVLLRKKVFIYSQGIGPINSNSNRRRTARILKKVHGIVVRDEQSAKLLREIGVTNQIHVTADPVIRMKKPENTDGTAIILDEAPNAKDGSLLVGWAVRAMPGDTAFLDEIEKAIRWLKQEHNAVSILIPFHYEQDIVSALELEKRLDGTAYCLKNKHLSSDMLSIIGSLDILVGVRLHSLIYGAVMGVPMIGISYDPKIDGFLHSVNMEPMSSVQHFTSDAFAAAFADILKQRTTLPDVVTARINKLKTTLDINEDLILKVMEKA